MNALPTACTLPISKSLEQTTPNHPRGRGRSNKATPNKLPQRSREVEEQTTPEVEGGPPEVEEQATPEVEGGPPEVEEQTTPEVERGRQRSRKVEDAPKYRRETEL